jgi:hypothetical protein
MLSLFLLAAFAAQAPATEPPIAQDSSAVVSLERIREALAAPPSRVNPPPHRTPDFVVQVVTDRQRVDRLIAPVLQFDSGIARRPWFLASQPQVGTTPALAAVDVLALASAVRRQLAGAPRDRRDAAARRDVRQAIADYCAAQPNGGTAIRICMDPTSVR